MSDDKEIELDHHKQNELCATRPPYRQGRKLTAIKTYTINSESVYLLIFGVPKINLRTELKMQCKKYGALTSLTVAASYKTEQFTECYVAKYDRIQSARVAKRKLDTRNFFGGVLHVCYAPEMENIEETRCKLDQRRFEVNRQLIRYELSTKSIVEMLRSDAEINYIDTTQKNSCIISPIIDNSLMQDNVTSHITEVSLLYSSKYPSLSTNSLPSIGPVQIESIPNNLPKVNINNLPNSYSSDYHDVASKRFKGNRDQNVRLGDNFVNQNNSNCMGNSKFEINSNYECNSKFNMFSIEDISENSTGICCDNNGNNKQDDSLASDDGKKEFKKNEVEYVFKRKRKKNRSKTVVNKKGANNTPNASNSYFNFLNSVEILKESDGKDDADKAVDDFGKVTVYDAVEKPKIVKLPQKHVNKIVFNVKNDKPL